MRMNGVRPEVGAPLIHLPLSANFFANFCLLRGPFLGFTIPWPFLEPYSRRRTKYDARVTSGNPIR